METLLIAAVFAVVGAIAQFVDGSLGMGFGITSATMLSLLGYSAVAASAGTHAAKMGTCFVSGVAHWRLGNVDWKILAAIGIPGGIGAFTGAVILTNIAMDSARVWMAFVLLALGGSIIARFGFNKSLIPQIHVRTRHLWPVGLVGGFVDATGGGGWGPVATPSMFSLTKHEPYRIVGTVSAAEFVVAACASAGFIFGTTTETIPWVPVLGLIAGGLITAPIAARFVRRMPHAAMGVLIGFMVLISNGAIVMKSLGVPGALAGVIVAVTVVIAGTDRPLRAQPGTGRGHRCRRTPGSRILSRLADRLRPSVSEGPTLPLGRSRPVARPCEPWSAGAWLRPRARWPACERLADSPSQVPRAPASSSARLRSSGTSSCSAAVRSPRTRSPWPRLSPPSRADASGRMAAGSLTAAYWWRTTWRWACAA